MHLFSGLIRPPFPVDLIHHIGNNWSRTADGCTAFFISYIMYALLAVPIRSLVAFPCNRLSWMFPIRAQTCRIKPLSGCLGWIRTTPILVRLTHLQALQLSSYSWTRPNYYWPKSCNLTLILLSTKLNHATITMEVFTVGKMYTCISFVKKNNDNGGML